MNLLANKKKINILAWLLLTAVVALTGAVNYFYPLYSDDYLYSFKFNPGFVTDDPASLQYQKIDSVGQYFESLSLLYNNLTGRVVAHGMLQFILLFNPHVFDIVNTLMLLALCWLIVAFATGKINHFNPVYVLVVYLFYYAAVLKTSANFYLAAFSCNYVWTSVLVMAFLLPYRLFFDNHRFKEKSFKFAFLMLISGFLAGATNEPVGPGLLLFTGLLGLYLLIFKKKVPLWQYTAFAGLLVGFLFLFMAPGNSARQGYEVAHGGLNDNTSGISINLHNVVYIVLTCFALVPVVLVALVAWLKKRRSLRLNKLAPAWALITISLGVAFALMFVPTLLERITLVLTLYLVVLCMYLIVQTEVKQNILLLAAMIIVGPVFAENFVNDWTIGYNAQKEYELTRQQIESGKSATVLVKPRAYLDPLTRPNWAKPAATWYNIDSLWVVNVFDQAYVSNALPLHYKVGQETYYNSVKKQDISLSAISVYQHNKYSATCYAKFKSQLAGKQFDNISMQLYYGSWMADYFTWLPKVLQQFLFYTKGNPFRPVSFKLANDGLLIPMGVRGDITQYQRLRFIILFDGDKSYTFDITDIELAN